MHTDIKLQCVLLITVPCSTSLQSVSALLVRLFDFNPSICYSREGIEPATSPTPLLVSLQETPFAGSEIPYMKTKMIAGHSSCETDQLI